jgi:hypothetical protein
LALYARGIPDPSRAYTPVADPRGGDLSSRRLRLGVCLGLVVAALLAILLLVGQ